MFNLLTLFPLGMDMKPIMVWFILSVSISPPTHGAKFQVVWKGDTNYLAARSCNLSCRTAFPHGPAEAIPSQWPREIILCQTPAI